MAIKLATIVGTRPQFIKAAVVSRAIREHNREGPLHRIEEFLVHTGQHSDAAMSEVFFQELELSGPQKRLRIEASSHAEMIAQMLLALEPLLQEQKPDWILAYGDSNSTLAAALAASQLKLPLAHVEAGLRSFDPGMPEEINRVLTDHVASLLFCPSEVSLRNLAAEGVHKGVYLTGDVLLDAARYYSERAPTCPFPKPFVLATVHRAANTDDVSRLSEIVSSFEAASLPVIFPVHPRTRKVLESHSLRLPVNVRRIEPMSYVETLAALKACEWVVTDSGGLQREAYYLGKKCIVARETTEWVELVERDAARLAGADPEKLVAAMEWARQPLLDVQPIYGGGHAAEQIVQIFSSKGLPDSLGG